MTTFIFKSILIFSILFKDICIFLIYLISLKFATNWKKDKNWKPAKAVLFKIILIIKLSSASVNPEIKLKIIPVK